MKEVRDIFNILARIVIGIGYWLGCIYVPALDRPEWGFDEDEKEDNKPPSTARPSNVIKREYGTDTPDGKKSTIFYQSENMVMFSDGLGWEFDRYDGTEGVPFDFSEWDETDEIIMRERGYTDAQRERYIQIRPFVVVGMKNKGIMKQTGLKKRSVEKYAADVRAAFRLRIAEMQAAGTPSPIIERGG